MLNKRKYLDTQVVVTASLLFFYAQADTKGYFICFNDPLIKGDSVQTDFVDCIDAISVSLSIKNRPPFCTFSASFSMGSHSGQITLAVAQSRPLKDVGVFIQKKLKKLIEWASGLRVKKRCVISSLTMRW